jgi:DNA-binding protein H-NS
MTTSPSIRLTETTSVMARANGAPANHAGSPAEATAAPSLPIDLDRQPDEVLAALAVAVPKKIAARKAKREADFFALMKEGAKALDVSPTRLAAELGVKLPAAARKAGTAPGAIRADDARRHPKAVYRNPNNPAQVWTKKGLQPKWFEECLKAGMTEADLRIPENDGGGMAKE